MLVGNLGCFLTMRQCDKACVDVGDVAEADAILCDDHSMVFSEMLA